MREAASSSTVATRIGAGAAAAAGGSVLGMGRHLEPRLFEAVRLTLGSAWLFLIAAEAIAATQGLGYRIFLVRRYLDMSVILPYVFLTTLLAFAMD